MMVSIPCDHGDALPSAKLLNRIEINPCLKQPCSEGMAKVMEAKVPYSGFLRCGIECSEKISGAYSGCISGMKNILGLGTAYLFSLLQDL
jgi:hypothetical protein